MSFLKNTEGNFSIIFAITSMTMMTTLGIAVEMSNLGKQDRYMQDAIDNAVLAAAIKMEQGATSDISEVESYGEAIFLATTSNNNLNCEIEHLRVIQDASIVETKAHCETNTTFPFMDNLMPRKVEVNAKATYGGNSKYELALMLDASGSMGGSRMTILKASVNDMIDTLIPASGESNVRIALAPYSSSVNAGLYGDVATGITDLYTHTISNLGANPNSTTNTNGSSGDDEDNTLLNYAPNGIGSLTMPPEGFKPGTGLPASWGFTTTSPDAEVVVQPVGGTYVINPNGTVSWIPDERDPVDCPEGKCAAIPGTKDEVAGVWQDTDWSDPNNFDAFDWSLLGDDYAANVGTTACVTERIGDEAFTNASPIDHPVGAKASQCPVSAVEPLTDRRDILHDGVNSLVASGGTAGHLGIAWSWYTLSPEWSDLWAPNRRTESDDPEESIQRIAVLMTDGSFNSVYESAILGSSTVQSQNLCDGMKADGITVYSIAFSAPSNGQAIMQYCASTADHYFNVTTADQVQAAYQNIASNLGGVRLTH